MNRLFLSTACLVMIFLAACNITTPDVVTPTAQVLATGTGTAQITASITPSQTPPPSPTNEVVEIPIVVSSPLPTQNLLPTELLTPTATPGPCTETVQQGDTLTIILFRTPCGNQVTQGLINAVVALNDNLANPDILPAVGSTILIPLPSPTPIPEGADMTATAQVEDGVVIIGSSRFVEGQEFGCYQIQEGDTIVEIADIYNTTLEVLSQQNPNLNWSGCDFTNPSGGPACNPGLRIGQCVNVPFPTSTPVPTATLSGHETATATPTHEAVYTFYPPEDASVVSQRITLEWITVGILQPGEIYLVEVEDRTASTSNAYVTDHTRFTLPDRLIPTDGQTHTMAWRVRVALINANGTYTPIGAAGDWRSFHWQSR